MINPHPDSPAVDRLDAYLVNFRLHLPDNKRQLVSGDGKLDEMLFQANMITEAYVFHLSVFRQILLPFDLLPRFFPQHHLDFVRHN